MAWQVQPIIIKSRIIRYMIPSNNLSPATRKPEWPEIVIWIVFAAIWFLPLGFRDLIHPDEGRYANLSYAMLHTGDWLTPRLNGILYFEKPAMQYWAGAAAFYVLGVNEFAARFWPALTGFLTVVMVAYTSTVVWSRLAGQLAALVAGSSAWLIGNAHFLNLDMGLTFFLTVTLCGFLLAQQDKQTARGCFIWMMISWAAIAGAILSKGLVGLVIPGAVLFFYSVFSRHWSLWKRMHWVSGVALMLVLAAPWLVAVSLENKGFAHFFFVHEHFERFLTTEHHRAGPIWYFVPLLILGFLPWTSLLPAVAKEGARRDVGQRFQPALFALVWAGFVFVFFSVSGSKLPSYILPMFPAMALILGVAISKYEAVALKKHLIVPIAFWLLVIGAWLFSSKLLSASTNSRYAIIVLLQASAAGGVIALIGYAFAWKALNRNQVLSAMVSVSLVSLIAVTCMLNGHNVYGQTKTSKHIVAAIAGKLDSRAPFFSVRYYDQTLPFYLRKPVILVDYVDEFDFGEHQEPDKWIPTLDGFIVQWNSLPKAYAMMKPDTYQALQGKHISMTVLYQDKDRMVVVKP